MNRVLGIDMSLLGTGLCLLDRTSTEPKPPVLETLSLEDVTGMARFAAVIFRISHVVDKYRPDVVVIEDYAMGGGKGTNNLTRLAELGGAVKWQLHCRGYEMGYGTARNEIERADAHRVTLHAPKICVLQPSASMKKFCLNDGAAKKDSRYLLTVQEWMGVSFVDDNQADAYMHAYMAGIVLGVIRGTIPIGGLPEHHQVALMMRAQKRNKGMSVTKAMKLSDEEKLKLVQL